VLRLPLLGLLVGPTTTLAENEFLLANLAAAINAWDELNA
jgi:hypothetical protein